MQEPPKFKVGDRVRIISDNKNFSGKPIGYQFIVSQIFSNEPYYREFVGVTTGVAEQDLELVEPAIDYKDTYVRVCSEEEWNKAINFYESKGGKHTSNSKGIYNNMRIYVSLNGSNEICTNYDSFFREIKYIRKDITEEVLGKKEEKIIEKCKEEYTESKKHIEEKRKESKFDFYDWCKTNYNPDFKPQWQHNVFIDNLIPFNNLPTKKMSTLRNNLRDRFFKKEESKLADLIEKIEEGFEPVVELYNRLDKITNEQEDLVKELDSAVELKDKSAIKEAKKKLEEFKKETIEDKLFEQLVTIGKKLVK